MDRAANMAQAKQKPGRGESLVRTYVEVDPSIDMTQWPMFKDVKSIWEEEGVPPRQEGGEEFWKAAIRWSLLKKYSHCPKELENPYKKIDDRFVLDFWEEDIKIINSIWEEQCALATSGVVSSSTEDKDLREFLISGLSNGRKLQWSMMQCGPGKQFQLHAHPNFEICYCLRGALHEIRMNGQPLTKTFEADTKSDDTSSNVLKGPDLSSLGRSWNFATLREGEFLINEVGSIHKSFTATNGEGCQLLLLWGGSHADITSDKEPKTLIVQDALEKMDKKLCDCVANKTDIVPETFLPESEPSQ